MARENVNCEDSVDSSVRSDVESSDSVGELLRVGNIERSWLSRSMLDMDWRGASLSQDPGFDSVKWL